MPINNSSIDISQQQAFIKLKGEWVKYYRGLKCTCSLIQQGSTLPDANRADPNCSGCNGLGWIWIDSGLIQGMVTNIDQHKELIQAGILSPGDLVFTPTLDVTISDYDKIQLTWAEGLPFEGETIQRGSGVTDNTLYGIVSVPPGSCIQVNSANGDITTYTSGADFSFDGSQITWGLSDNQPLMGSTYSLKYQALIEWIAWMPPQPRYERGTNLGQRVPLKKKHVVFNGV